jgi:hypothetical protein
MSRDDSDNEGADPPAFSAQDAMAFMQRMWNPFAMPMPGSASGAVTPAEPTSAGEGDATRAAAPGAMPSLLPFPNPAAMFAALDPAEVERRIGELRIIEGWLRMSLDLTQMSMRTLELQRASLEALHAARAPAKGRSEAKSRKR